jgi:hypothetical protein
MSPVELLSAGDHLAACRACRERVQEAGQFGAEPRRLWADLQAEDESDHLSYEQLASYAEGHLDEFDRAIVNSHLGVCPSCEEEVKDLLEFSRRVGPAPARLSPAEEPRAILLRRWPVWLSATRAAAAAAFLCMCLMAGLYWLRREPEPHNRTALRTHPEAGPAVTPSQPDAHAAGTPPSDAAPPAPPPSVEQRGRTTAVESGGKPPARAGESSPPPARAVVALLDGGQEVVLDHGGDMRGLEGLPPRLRKTLYAALLSQGIRKPGVVAELYGGPLTLLGDSHPDGSLTPVSPVGTVVLGTRPTFRWSSLNGATGYVVEVYGPELNPVATSGTVTTTQWTVEHPLPRGVVYRWQVTALKNGERVRAPKPPAPEAKFKVLEEDKAGELADIGRLAPGSHLAPGVLYALAGLADDSERELRSLVKDNPRSEVAKRILESIRAWRR